MSTASGLEFFDADSLADPYAFYEKHRAQGVNFCPRAEAYLKEKGFGRVPHVIVMDPPRHTAFRGVLDKVLREKRFHQMRPQIRTLATALIDGFAEAGQCEFVRDYAWKLSVLVVADLLGVDRARIDEYKRWADDWVRPGKHSSLIVQLTRRCGTNNLPRADSP